MSLPTSTSSIYFRKVVVTSRLCVASPGLIAGLSWMVNFYELLKNFSEISTFVLDTANATLTNAVVMQLAIFRRLVNIEINLSIKRDVPPPEHIQ
ncbi:hypothetical protein BDZ94DRAFT_1305810 [Collybia nuda]|uniref:Uncharacterized protein n=1 Tax=Collybia nuda TaxID=64659 RepID=A0A9P6CI51_9AGAR|nr:hypothetical protein BDZ94DRAFT_1305810 [Collybia nuda]